jgi:dephospho-CoA kinase
MKRRTTKLIGITGGIGTGKSTVAKLFARRGAVVLDADAVTHALMKPGTAVSKKIKARFGPKVFLKGGKINRAALGKIVFSDPKKLKSLTAIIHPAVRREIFREVAKLRSRRGVKAIVLDVPLLLESRAYPVDVVVVADAPWKTAVRRVQKRSRLTEAEIRRRASFQMPLSAKKKEAHFVVNNAGSLKQTGKQVSSIWKRIIGE